METKSSVVVAEGLVNQRYFGATSSSTKKCHKMLQVLHQNLLPRFLTLTLGIASIRGSTPHMSQLSLQSRHQSGDSEDL